MEQFSVPGDPDFEPVVPILGEARNHLARRPVSGQLFTIDYRDTQNIHFKRGGTKKKRYRPGGLRRRPD
jgi:hypothetical protein